MPLETGNYISDLVETNPPGTDNVSQGDDHLRLIKHVLKETFPNIDGPVTSTDEELSNLSGGLPLVTTYSNAATGTHTFEVGRKWYKIIATGGGGGGGNISGDANRGWGGNGAATVIMTRAIVELSAIYTLGSGGAVNANGEDTLWVEGANAELSAGGGTIFGGVPASASGGDLNLDGATPPGTADRSDCGAGSYWGGSTDVAGRGVPGSGGLGGDNGQPPTDGINGTIIIEEY